MKIYDDQLIVITGGAGFIGSCVVKYLNDKGLKNLIIVDDFDQSDKWKNLVGKQFIDVLDKDHLFEWLKGRESTIEAIIHLGACADTTEIDSAYLLENNYRFSIHLAEYAINNEIRFIYASSAATYGDGSRGFSDSHDLLENYEPLNMYGYSKHLFDLWVKNQGFLDRVVGLKFFNVYGPNEKHKGRMASAIIKFTQDAMSQGVVRLFKSTDQTNYPDGGQQRDFIYVKDVAKAIAAFLENDKFGIYNLGSGKASSWNDLANAVFKAINKPCSIEYIDMPLDLVKQYQNYTCADMSKTKEALGTSLQLTSLDRGVVEYVRDYLLPEKRW